MLHKKIKIFVPVIVPILLCACGFRPLYVQHDGDGAWYSGESYNSSIVSELAQIKVEPIEDRFGQIIRNELIDSLTPKGAPTEPRYRLYVMLAEKQIVQQALRDDITATRERVKYTVNYFLEENHERLLNGNSIAFVSYDIMANPYSTTSAQKKTERDAAKIIADDIALRLGAYFHSKITNLGGYSEF